MKEYLSSLLHSELFRDIPVDVLLEELLPQGHVTELRKGQFCIEPQQLVDQFSIILSGKVHILHLFPDGNYSLTAALAPGEAVGIDLICTHNKSAPYHAIAAVPTRLLTFPARVLLEPGILRESCRQTAVNRLLTLIADQNMKKEYRLAILSQKGLRERIVTYLSMQSGKRRSPTFRIPFTREEMASFLCVNRSALSHELSLMEQEGLISFRKNEFTLLNPEKWQIHNRYDL